MRRPVVAIVIGALVVAVGAAAIGVLSLGSMFGNDPAPLSSPASSSAFTDYTPETFSSVPEADTVVLFFHATWCPTCKQLADDITANVDRIPSDVRILLVDFDTATDLKQKYGVTLQHTLVQVDTAGIEAGRWIATPTLDELLVQLN